MHSEPWQLPGNTDAREGLAELRTFERQCVYACWKFNHACGFKRHCCCAMPTSSLRTLAYLAHEPGPTTHWLVFGQLTWANSQFQKKSLLGWLSMRTNGVERLMDQHLIQYSKCYRSSYSSLLLNMAGSRVNSKQWRSPPTPPPRNYHHENQLLLSPRVKGASGQISAIKTGTLWVNYSMYVTSHHRRRKNLGAISEYFLWKT